MDDRELRRLLEDELDFEPSINASHIGVAVDQGIVRLTGHVTTLAQKIAIEGAVKRMRGVRGFVDDIKVKIFDTESDETIAARIANLIDWDATLPKGAIKVRVKDGGVTLLGEVDWPHQRLAAETSVHRLPGVRTLQNFITVVRQVKGENVQHQIERALERDAALEASRITVTVDGGKVRLEGEVETLHQRELVERAAWSAPGVDSVDDRLALAGARP